MKAKKIKLVSLLTCTSILACSSLQATAATCPVPSDSNYALSVDVAGNCGTSANATMENFLDKLTNAGLNSIVNGYNGTQVSTITANFNSLDMSLAFPNSGNTGAGAQLHLNIPALGINQTFTGVDRDASKGLLTNYLKSSDILSRIAHYQAGHAANSPITGAGGLLPTVIASDFNQSFTDTATNIAAPLSVASDATSGDKTAPNLIGIGLSYGSFNSNNSNTKVTSLPLSYTIRNNLDPRRQLVFSLPITQLESNGAKSYSGGLGVGYRFPINDNWTLTPAARFSGVGSVDLGTAAAMYSASLSSTYIWRNDGFDIAMGNMLAYTNTMKFKAGEYEFNPNISNTTLRNGVMLSQPVNMGGKKMSIEYSAIDTRYMGTKIFLDNTQEIGITLGTNKNAFSSRSFIRGGATYLHGKDTNGFTVNIGYWF